MEATVIIRILSLVVAILDDKLVKRLLDGIMDLIEELIHEDKEGS